MFKFLDKLIWKQVAFWLMLFNWIEYNKYSIIVGPERRNILVEYCYTMPQFVKFIVKMYSI